jgi:large subunit ribosomal protein L32
VCPQCRETKLPHRVCPHCGYYKGREIVAVEGT